MRVSLFVILAVVTMGLSVAAQTSLSLWPYYIEVKPEKSAPGIYDVIVPLAVFDKSGAELGDLRLFDSSNREIPYAIRVRKEVDEVEEFEGSLFNHAQVGSASEASVDLGENPEEHNQVEIETMGTNFRRQVSIEGSDNGRDWRMLNNSGVLLSFKSENNAVESNRVSYPASRYRYLRVRVQSDSLTDTEAPRITGVTAMKAVREKGQWASWSVPVPSYQLLRNQGAHASVWTIDLGARAPCDRLTLEVDDDSFSRPFQVESVDDPQHVQLIASGTLTRHSGGENKPLVIVFDDEENVRKLRLQIIDHSNPTLNITSIQASAPARQLVYELKEPASQPLRLYFGNASVPAPHYDFETELQAKPSLEPGHSSFGDVTANPQYQPEPRPLTERVPWLIYLVLAISSIALAFILVSLARSAMRGGGGTQATN
ncbi:MAG TPA: DUF3999 family protein [Pyrinomonadaceae bacterium]|nr:DUF3999 family protein [Pyrinomonadaceae bacterium]